LKIHFNIFFHLCLGLPSGVFPSGFLTKTLSALLTLSMRAACSVHPNLLDLITLIIGEAPYYAISSFFMLFPLPSVCVSSVWQGINVHIHTKYMVSYSFVYFNLYVSHVGYRKTKDSEVRCSKCSSIVLYS
jgi:hypothetical protein